jgi:hypothetical protein
MANEIGAAVIQAGAILITGVYGLTSWRMQLREARQVEHAEKALAAAAPMFSAIREARSPLHSMTREEAANRTTTIQARQRITVDRLHHAWAAWLRFQGTYALARLFADPTKPQLDVAKEVVNSIRDLEGHVMMMMEYEEDTDAAPPEELVEARRAFYASRPKPDDPIEAQLIKAEKALETELRSILVLEPSCGQRLFHTLNICNRRRPVRNA